ncbi:hypothetical protein AAC387_Pa01g2623 [Persea americana]
MVWKKTRRGRKEESYHLDVEIHKGGNCGENVIRATMELELLKGGAFRIDRGEVGFSSSDEDLPEKKVAVGEGFEAHVDVILQEEMLIVDKAGSRGVKVDCDGEEGEG